MVPRGFSLKLFHSSCRTCAAVAIPGFARRIIKVNGWFSIGLHSLKVLHMFSGWWFQPLWKIWKSVGVIIPNWMGKTCSKPPTMFETSLIHLQWISWPPNDVRRRCSYCHQRESRMGGWSWPLQTASFRTCEDVIFWVFLQVPSLNDPIWYVFPFFLFPSAPTCPFGVTSWWTPTCFRISQGDVDDLAHEQH